MSTIDEGELDRLAGQLREYASDWRVRAASTEVVDRAADALEDAARALSAEKAAREEAERKHLEVCAVANRDNSMLFTAERHVENLKAKLTTAETEAASLRERVKALEAVGRSYAIRMEYDYPADVPEPCGLWCEVCEEHVEDDRVTGHSPTCPLGRARATLEEKNDG